MATFISKASGQARRAFQPSALDRTLTSACLAHFLHDGFTDQLYALLPVWQSQFGLDYAGLAIVRALYFATMGGLQIPANRLFARKSTRLVLVGSTLIASAGYALVAMPFGFAGLCFGLIVAGIGSSLQHPRASQMITHRFGAASRGPLGLYNFAGDLGKATLPALVAFLLPLIAWRSTVVLSACLGTGVGFALFWLLPAQSRVNASEPLVGWSSRAPSAGFTLLVVIGALDTATRMGYLLFLPFIVKAAGGDTRSVGLALTLLFAGGALGKACCGWLGARCGTVATVIVTEAATAGLIAATLMTSLGPMMVLLPVLGTMLNGTSSVLYGTVPELARGGEDAGRAFAIFYTGVIGAGGLAPILYGVVADHSSRLAGTIAAACTAAVIIPLVIALGPCLRKSARAA